MTPLEINLNDVTASDHHRARRAAPFNYFIHGEHRTRQGNSHYVMANQHTGIIDKRIHKHFPFLQTTTRAKIMIVTVPDFKWDKNNNLGMMLGRALPVTYLGIFSTFGMILLSNWLCRHRFAKAPRNRRAAAHFQVVRVLVIFVGVSVQPSGVVLIHYLTP
ncbi:hypothetical protein BJ138DRAFT_1105191 [Hygrophoropsis aurantiaca]|uniref:Uncharacterized protein n=1 Tax=Hygrophoropsis aurantiaca TaxID=72124 RepID=A0ACB8A0F8_9AGAM|nr:hypothetical protein BJ138DRAFT_1105191 [Hygrophoropsis aurantiaca]